MSTDDWQSISILLLALTVIGNSECIAQLSGRSNVQWIMKTLKRIFRWACSGGSTGKQAKSKDFSSSPGDAVKADSTQSTAQSGSTSRNSRDRNL